ncbi:MAG: hypothetical protein AAGA30_20115, partial [Planctomycetota bacterium]
QSDRSIPSNAKIEKNPVLINFSDIEDWSGSTSQVPVPDPQNIDDNQAQERRSIFRRELKSSLPDKPLGAVFEYREDDGDPVPITDQQANYLSDFSGFYFNPAVFDDRRLYGDSVGSFQHWAVWKSPGICFRPLYFEDVNLERFGARKPFFQPGISAVHFFGSVVSLPYHAGLDAPWDCQFVAAYGRPGNRYCYQRERPVWSLKGGTLQALLATGVIFGLP